MKKYLTLRNCMICCGVVVALVAFFISFAANLTLESGGVTMTYHNIIWGCNKMSAGGMSVSGDPMKATGISVAGLVIILVAAIAAVVCPLVIKNEKIAKWVVVGCGAAMVLGGIFMFLTYDGFAGVLAGETGQEKKDILEQLKQTNAKAVVPVVEGVLAILAGGAVCGSQFVPNKALVK